MWEERKKQNPEEPSHAVVSVNVQQSVLRMCVYLHKEESVCQSADLTVSFTPLLFIFSLLKRRNVESVIIDSGFVKGKNHEEKVRQKDISTKRQHKLHTLLSFVTTITAFTQYLEIFFQTMRRIHVAYLASLHCTPTLYF